MKFKWIAALLLIVALGLGTAALAAGNDNDVEWNGTGHIPGKAVCDQEPAYFYRSPGSKPRLDLSVTMRARAYKGDLTGVTIWYTANDSAAVQGDWSSVAASWEVNWLGCGGLGDMDIYRGTIPFQDVPRVWYKIEYIDGTDHDWRRGSGEGITGFYDDDGGWTTGSTSLSYYPDTVTRCQPEQAYGAPGYPATVCIYVQDVVALYGVDFEISFPGMLGIATVVDEMPGWPSGVQIMPNTTFMSEPWNLLFNIADNSTGYLHYLVTELYPSMSKTGSGPIACMHFQGLGVSGEFTMTFTRHDLSDRNGVMFDDTAHTCKITFSPTAVVLSRFEAWPIATGNHVQWETVEEIDNLGFNLYRSATLEGIKTKLNRTLIPAKNPGSPLGAVYDWNDIYWLRPGRSSFYWLEDIDIHGHATMHGPAKLRATPVTVD